MTYVLDFIANGEVVFQKTSGLHPLPDLRQAANDILDYVNSVSHPCYLLTDSTELKSTEVNLIAIRDIYKPLTDHPRFMASVVYGSSDMVALNFVVNTVARILHVSSYVSKSQSEAVAYILKLAPHLDGFLQADLKRLAAIHAAVRQ